MNEPVAAAKADAILLQVLAHQPEIISRAMFNSTGDAETAAEAVAAFRRRLIVKLVEQGN